MFKAILKKLYYRLVDTTPMPFSMRCARIVSLLFAITVGDGILIAGMAHVNYDMRQQEQMRLAVLAQKAEDMRQTICLTNVVHHEARGETPEVRAMIGKVVIAAASDPSFTKARNVCDLAKIGGKFSNIKFVTEIRSTEKGWPKIHEEMTAVYKSDRILPAGWHCVREFRVSDDELEKLSSKSLQQLGITVNAKGLKYFTKANVPVDTRGKVTFYSARGGCKNPTQTAMR